MSETISWADFEKVVIAVGTVVRAERNEQDLVRLVEDR